MSEIKQRTEEWFKIREGRFTASKINRLLGKGTLARTKNSIKTYASEKAIEQMYGREEDTFMSADMERGVVQEPLAFKIFSQLKSLEFLEVRECGFFEFGKDAGASPDGLVSDNSILEIKCPRRNKFFKIVANGIDEVDADYIAQMQMQMLCTNADKAYFFNYYLEDNIQYWHEIIIQRDEEMIELIKERISEATNIKNDFIDKINNNIQC